MTLQLWVRCGDSDDYNPFPGVMDVAQYIYDMGGRHPLHFHTDMGVSCNAFRHQDYISVFWGGEEAGDSVRGLTREEFDYLNIRMRDLSLAEKRRPLLY